MIIHAIYDLYSLMFLALRIAVYTLFVSAVFIPLLFTLSTFAVGFCSLHPSIFVLLSLCIESVMLCI